MLVVLMLVLVLVLVLVEMEMEMETKIEMEMEMAGTCCLYCTPSWRLLCRMYLGITCNANAPSPLGICRPHADSQGYKSPKLGQILLASKPFCVRTSTGRYKSQSI